jgi:hypothetical protein
MQHMPITAKRNNMGRVFDFGLTIKSDQLRKAKFGLIMFRSAKMEFHDHLLSLDQWLGISYCRVIIEFLPLKGKTTCQLALISAIFTG